VVLAALLVVLGIVALSDDDAPNDQGQATPAPTTGFSLPTVATTLATTSTAPPTTIEKVAVPKLVGMRLARAKETLSDRGLTPKVTYKSTARYTAGTVIGQSRKAGAGVLPDTTITPGGRQGTAIATTERATGAAPDRAITGLPSLLP
jgi:hypothetical protein